jgi:outer membrane protein assembly factor BamB
MSDIPTIAQELRSWIDRRGAARVRRVTIALSLAGIMMLSCPAARDTVAECGSSGNTYWHVFVPTTTETQACMGPDGIFLTVGNKLSLLSPATGAETISRIFAGVTLGRVVTFELKTAIGAPATTHGVLVTGDNGYAYEVNSTTMGTIWSRSTQRTGYPDDAISIPPVVQMWASSDAAYKTARTSDTAIIATDYSFTTTANRIYGLDASIGNTLWVFNPTGGYIVDTIHGLALDYARNSVYVTSDKHLSSQNTAWSVNSLNGAKRWGVDLGPIDVPPVLAADRLYVVTRDGILYALDPDTGTTLWQITVTTLSPPTHLAVNAANGQVEVYVVADAALHAFADGCSGFAPLWTFTPTYIVDTTPVFLGGFVYVGDDNGKTWQVRASDGIANAFATISASGAAPSYDPLVFEEGPSFRLLASSGGAVKKLCIPWFDTPGDKAFLMPPFQMDPESSPLLALTEHSGSHP